MLSGRLREWEAAELADQLGYRDYEVRPGLDGRAVPPLAVAAWLEVLVEAHLALPPPRREQQNSRSQRR